MPTERLSEARRGGWRGFEAFAERAFALYWWSCLLETIGIEMLLTTVGWQVYGLTGRELDLGLIGLAQFAPFVLLFLVTGLAADRFPRARIMALCIAVQVLCAAGLLLMTWCGRIGFGHIIGVLVLFGISRAFIMPVQLSIVPLLVPQQVFSNGIVWAGAGNKAARTVGPAGAGVLIASGGGGPAGEAMAYGFVTALLVISLGLVALVRLSKQVLSKEPVSLHSMLAGLHFIGTRKIILGAISLDLFAVLLGGGAMALLPVFAKDILQVGPEGFGLLRAAAMGGALAGGFVLARWSVTGLGGPLLFGTTAVFGLCGFLLGLSQNFWLSVLVLAVMGAANTLSVVIRHALVQLITPDEMRGRVGATVGVFLGASNDLGSFEAGLTAHWWGAIPAVLVGGAATIGVTALFAWTFPVLRRVDSLDGENLNARYRFPHDRRGRTAPRADSC